MKDKEFYTCEYCFKEFVPRRRRVQKFCSDTCRSKAHHAKQSKKSLLTKFKEDNIKVPQTLPPIPSKIKVQSISAAGVGNAALGTLAADGVKSFFTPMDNKPATKGDLKKLAAQINGRFHLVKNLPPRYDGALPYYDIETGNIIYFN